MRWRDGRRSRNIEDRRGKRVARGVAGGGVGMLLLALVAMYFGVDPSIVLQRGVGSGPVAPSSTPLPPEVEDELSQFVSVILADTEDTWKMIFRKMGRVYEEPVLVLYSGTVSSACGMAQAAMGPFYCPGDHKVYIDLSFYRDLQEKMHAPGDFAQAYVISHEVGHHVQTLLGISDKVQSLRSRVSRRDGNRLSVALELQADCFAGVWAHNGHKMRNILEDGDVEEGLNAASMIGDDRLQKEARGYAVPDSFTHGSSAQRVRWFSRGLRSGDIDQCNTFAADSL